MAHCIEAMNRCQLVQFLFIVQIIFFFAQKQKERWQEQLRSSDAPMYKKVARNPQIKSSLKGQSH